MCDYIINRRFSDQAKILSTAAGSFARYAISVVGVQVDLVLTELKRPSGDPILADTVSSNVMTSMPERIKSQVASTSFTRITKWSIRAISIAVFTPRLFFQGERCRNWTLKDSSFPRLKKIRYQMDFKLSGDTIFDVI